MFNSVIESRAKPAISAVLASIFLVGCLANYKAPSPTKLEQATREKIEEIDPRSFDLVRELSGPYVDIVAIETSSAKQGSLRRQVSLYVRDIEFEEAIDYLLEQEQVPYVLASDVIGVSRQKVSVNFTGELFTAVELLASLIGGGADIDERGVVRIYRTATRDFPIAVPGGDISWTMSAGGTQLGGTSGGGGGGSSGGGGGGGGSSGGGGGGGGVSDSGTISASASLSLWDDISSSLEQFLDDRGTFFVSQAAGLITVTAPVTVLSEVEEYVESINHQLTRRVEINFKLLEVSMSRNSNLGIDWSAIRTEAAVTIGAAGTSYESGATIQGNGGATPTTTGGVGSINNGIVIQGGSGDQISRVLLNALRTQGHVTIAHSPTAVTLNNQPVILSDVTTRGYAAETTAGVSTATGTSGGGITPGQITEGSQFMVIPKIVGRDVVIYVQAIISNALEFETFSSGDGTTQSSIQLPNVASKGFAVRIKMPDGGAALIGGLTREESNVSEREPFFIDILGDTARQGTKVETVLMLQAKILEG